MNHAVICIGSNLEPRDGYVSGALEWIFGLLEGVQASSIYETPEIHGIGRPYMNLVAEADTDFAFDQLKEHCKRYELEHGRDDEARRRGDVPVDIDIVVWNGEILRPKDVRQNFFKIGAAEINLAMQSFR